LKWPFCRLPLLVVFVLAGVFVVDGNAKNMGKFLQPKKVVVLFCYNNMGILYEYYGYTEVRDSRERNWSRKEKHFNHPPAPVLEGTGTATNTSQ
jgi:hypothetical protein